MNAVWGALIALGFAFAIAIAAAAIVGLLALYQGTSPWLGAVANVALIAVCGALLGVLHTWGRE